MDSGDYVAGLLMGCAPPGLDLAALDGVGDGFLDALCGGGGGGAGLAAARVSGPRCGGSREGSSVSDPAWARAAEGNACRKRKAPAGGCAGKGKEEAFLGTSPCKVGGEAAAKKCKVETKPKVEEAAVSDGGGEVEESGQKRGKGKSSKPSAEPPKDYVHVRARRGQATDSHSLAERVRREKIGQRMKLLQDLVPGCNKVVGKALMLDEIINYVQSLQQQVEFLSMKLATVNPQLDFGSLATFLHKDMYQACGPSVSSGFPLESAGAAFPFCDQADLFQSFGPGIMENQCSLDLLDTALTHATNTQYAFQKQQREIWEDNLQNAMHFNNEQNQENAVLVPDFDGQIQTELEF